MGGGRRRQATKEERQRGGEEGGGGILKIIPYNIICIRELTDAVVVSRDSAETKCNQTMTGPTYGADYILEILGQKWRALRNHHALRNCQNLVLGKSNQVLLTIGQILGTAAENTGWLVSSDFAVAHFPQPHYCVILFWGIGRIYTHFDFHTPTIFFTF